MQCYYKGLIKNVEKLSWEVSKKIYKSITQTYYRYLLPEKVMLKSARKSKLSSFSRETSPIASTQEVGRDSNKTFNKGLSYRSPRSKSK